VALVVSRGRLVPSKLLQKHSAHVEMSRAAEGPLGVLAWLQHMYSVLHCTTLAAAQGGMWCTAVRLLCL
jgi:hypothetical protein